MLAQSLLGLHLYLHDLQIVVGGQQIGDVLDLYEGGYYAVKGEFHVFRGNEMVLRAVDTGQYISKVLREFGSVLLVFARLDYLLRL
jgi:hypothetical protein